MTIETKTTFDLSEWLQNPNWQDEVTKAVETKKFLKISGNKLEITDETKEQADPAKLFEFIEKYIPTLKESTLCAEIKERVKMVVTHQDAIVEGIKQKSWLFYFTPAFLIKQQLASTCDEITELADAQAIKIQKRKEEEEKEEANKKIAEAVKEVLPTDIIPAVLVDIILSYDHDTVLA